MWVCPRDSLSCTRHANANPTNILARAAHLLSTRSQQSLPPQSYEDKDRRRRNAMRHVLTAHARLVGGGGVLVKLQSGRKVIVAVPINPSIPFNERSKCKVSLLKTSSSSSSSYSSCTAILFQNQTTISVITLRPLISTLVIFVNKSSPQLNKTKF
ncbi:hypothetical protein RJT34_19509 [Clitoria ternatea]|uniref:Uncharacterized protein n=1 Tax=Clitoria ternatea TaxID=43366 RepID=A0AAN9IRE8_CLITE